MHIEGTYTLLARPERVWYSMRNQQILLRAVPGMRQIETLDAHTFAISLAMNQEPFTGECQGKLTISEQQFPYHYRLVLQGTNNQGQFQGEVSVHLQDRERSTIVAYTGTIHLDATGEPPSITLARGAAKLLIQQFFIALDNQLQATDALDADFATVERYDVYSVTGTMGMKSHNGVILKKDTSNPIVTIPLQSSVRVGSEPRSLFSAIVHLLGLGRGEPEQEQIWTYRLRRASTVASLLFLVWVGTRLPRPRTRLQRLPLQIHD